MGALAVPASPLHAAWLADHHRLQDSSDVLLTSLTGHPVALSCQVVPHILIQHRSTNMPLTAAPVLCVTAAAAEAPAQAALPALAGPTTGHLAAPFPYCCPPSRPLQPPAPAAVGSPGPRSRCVCRSR
jgi:hypothetical protein